MARFIALLRGVNLAGHKKVPMADLRKLLERLGHTQVATLLQSGNAVFSGRKGRDPAELAKTIEAAIVKKFRFDVRVVVRTRDELAAVIEANPLDGAEDDPSSFLVTFLSAVPDPAKLALIDPKTFRPDEFRVVGSEIYARFPNGIARSKLATFLSGTRLGVTTTARNWATVTKLLALADSAR